MKKHSVVVLASVLLVLVLLSMNVHAGTGDPAPCPDFFYQNPVPIDDWPKIASVNPDTAWAVSLGGQIIKTDDGGKTWDDQWTELQRQPETPPLRSISMVSQDVIWICGDGGAVIVTADGGTNWSLRNIPGLAQADQLFGISAVSDKVAWVVGGNGGVFRTDDGGKSWTSCPVPGVGDLSSVSALSAQNAWVSGDAGVVAMTTNGGTVWTSKDPASGPISSLSSIKAFDNTTVYTVGDRGCFYGTSDGGGSWTYKDMGSQVTLFGMSFTSDQAGWISGTDSYEAGFIAVTGDGGQNWKRESPPQLASERNVTAISSVDGNVVWACCVDGALLRSVDGGGQWDRSDTTWTRAILSSVSAIDSRSAWAVGESGTIMRTFNGGKSWVSQASHVPYALYSIDAVDSSTAWAVGDGGTIVKTTDYGKSWTGQGSGTEAELTGVSAVNDNEAWACGSDQAGGVVLHTSDGGGTWTQQVNPPGALVSSVAAWDAQTAWFGAADQQGGYIYRTTDGGESWEPRTLKSSVPIQEVVDVLDIRPINDKECLALVRTAVFVDSFIYMYKTTDGGDSWKVVGSDFIMANGSMFRLATVDGETIWSCGAQLVPYNEPTVTFYTGDGGENWNSGKDFHRTVMFGIDMAGDGTMWTVGYMGTIQRSTTPSVYSIAPDTAQNTGVVAIHEIAGSGFWDGMEVRLERDGKTIEATDVDVISPYKATCEFNLEGAGIGAYDVVTENVSGFDSRLADGFTVTTPTEWYLPEGSTGGDADGVFETWVLVENPNEDEAIVEITYMTPAGEVAGPRFTMAPESRRTVNVADTVPNQYSVSTKVLADRPVVAERAMYWNTSVAYRQCSHGSLGLNYLSEDWYLAEGSTGVDAGGSFETWVLVQNPGGEKANVQLIYLTPGGRVDGPVLELEPGTRRTVNVADTVPNEWSVSTVVESDVPVAAERATYWNAAGTRRQAASDSIGASSPATEWYLAEGSTRAEATGALETWILVENPYEHTVRARLYYQVPFGQVEGPEVILEPYTRKTVNIADTVPKEDSVSTRVVADGPVVAERSTYWNSAETYRQAAHASVGVMAPNTDWLVAEGSTGEDAMGGFDTWILVQNPGGEAADVELTYLTPDGPVAGPVFTLPPTSRNSVSVADTVPNEWSVSTMVVSDKPVVVDRSIYWSAASQFWRSAQSSKGYAPYGSK